MEFGMAIRCPLFWPFVTVAMGIVRAEQVLAFKSQKIVNKIFFP